MFLLFLSFYFSLLVSFGFPLSPSLLHFFFVLFIYLSIFLFSFRVSFVLFRCCFFSLFYQIHSSFSFLIFLMCWILLSVPDFPLLSFLFSNVCCVFKLFLLHFRFLPVFSSIGQHLYSILHWSSRFKLRFEFMPCGHEVAFSTKSCIMLYTCVFMINEEHDQR